MANGFSRYVVLPVALLTVILGGCASRSSAPVIERGVSPARTAATPTAASGRPAEFHTVRKGETLYSIAMEYGQSYRDVAAWNSIDNPNVIRIGQQLRVVPPEGVASVKPVIAPAVVEARPLGAGGTTSSESHKREPKGGKQPFSEQALAAVQKAEDPRVPPTAPKGETRPIEAVSDGEMQWTWPSGGRVISSYVDGGNKGVDIEGKIGDPVVAVEAGKVTYAGSGIRGYGNLLIVQHQNGLSSVYAHNSKLLAKEGQHVTKGQKIAELGNSDTDHPKLHFEIRRQGKPLDPLKVLPTR